MSQRKGQGGAAEVAPRNLLSEERRGPTLELIQKVWLLLFVRIFTVGMQVYAVALYVEADKAKAELQRLRAEGFFSQGYSDDRLMKALVKGRSADVITTP